MPSKRRSSTPPDGFGEAPQPALDGAPAGPVTDWARDVAAAADTEAAPAKRRGKPARRKKTADGPAKTARGTSLGGKASAKDRAKGGLMPVAGLDVALEDAADLPQSGVTASVDALSRLIEQGRPDFADDGI